MRRATGVQLRRLHETFEALCRIESPSGQERECADWVAGQLAAMGLASTEDDAGERAGSTAGNILARIPGTSGESILICTHLDTVPLTAAVEPVLVDGGWENAHEGILGADNTAAVAVALELARALIGAPGPPDVGVELLFTVCEEVALAGAREFDVMSLHSRFGYVFDHASPIGEIVLASPTFHRIVAEFHGRAAHAGIRPELGRNAIAAAARGIAAMRIGRLDDQTTANIGLISGGTGVNVVAERCTVQAETRSLDAARVQTVTTEMIDHLHDAANAAECDLDVTVAQLFKGYRTKPRAPQVQLAERALRACGYAPTHIVTGGGSDANALQAAGFPCTNLANGTERNHEPTERVSVDALQGMFEVALALVAEAAALDAEVAA